MTTTNPKTIQFDGPKQKCYCIPLMHFVTVDTNLAFVPSLWGLHKDTLLYLTPVARHFLSGHLTYKTWICVVQHVCYV
jgi:hypothetical protein